MRERPRYMPFTSPGFCPVCGEEMALVVEGHTEVARYAVVYRVVNVRW